MRLKQTVWIFILLVLTFSAVAAPPFLTESQTSGESGLIIKYPQQPFYLTGSSMDMHFHVFNSTGHPIDDSITSCFIHVYNSTENHLLKKAATYDNYDFEVELGSNITSVVGYYSYIFQCVNDDVGGFVGEAFEITDTQNKEQQISGSVLAVLILSPMIFGIFLLIAALALNPEEHPALRIFMILLSFMTYIISAWFGVISIIRFYNFPEMQAGLASSIWIIGIMISVIIIYFLIYAFYKATHAAAQRKKEEMLQ